MSRISDILSGNGIQKNNDIENRQKYDKLSEYIRAADYEGIFSLDLRHMVMVRIEDVPFELIAADIAANCPYEIKRRYPAKLLRFAYELYAGGMENEYYVLMGEIKGMIPSLPLSQDEKDHLMGEWIIVSALPCIRDIRTVGKKYELAAGLLHGKSDVIDAADPITFGFHGLPGVYLIEPGIADELKPEIRRAADLFSGFTGEPLEGMDVLYEGSLAYYRGNLDEAQRLAYKSIYLLETSKQDILQISAGEILALVAKHKGDVECFAEAIEYMNIAADRSINRLQCRCLVKLVHCGLLNTLGSHKEMPDWLKSFSFATRAYGSGPFGKKGIAGNVHFAPVSYGVAVWYHTAYLFFSGQYHRALATADIMREKLSKSKSVLILELYFTMLTACCYMILGERQKALFLLEQAIELALPDGFYLILADFAGYLDGMLENCLKRHDKNALKKIRSINDSFIGGINILKTEYLKAELPASLTYREQEVAILAAQSMRNTDIAEELGISLNTVKAHLKSVFEKLDIDKRCRLREKLK